MSTLDSTYPDARSPSRNAILFLREAPPDDEEEDEEDEDEEDENEDGDDDQDEGDGYSE